MKKIIGSVFVFAIFSVAFGQAATPYVSILDTPTISKVELSPQNGSQQSVVSATFDIGITAIGSDYFFNQNSFTFDIYKDGVKMTNPDVPSVVAYSAPPSGVITQGLPADEMFELQENNTISFPVTFEFSGPTTNRAFLGTNTYAIGLESVNVTTSSGDDLVINSIAGMPVGESSITPLVDLYGGTDIRVIAVPEPSMYAAILGMCAIGFVFVKQQKLAS